MISVIYKKPGFLKTLKYVLGKDNAEIINTNMAGLDPSLLNKQFLAVACLNKSVKRQCAHMVISIAARERLSNSQYHHVTQEYLKDLGYLPKEELSHNTSQFIAVRHHDRDHEHIHIVASRIQHNGKSVSDSFDYFKAEVSTRRISAQLGLEVTPVSNNAIASRLKEEYGITVEISPERQKSIKLVNSPHKMPTSKQIIRAAIKEAIKDSPAISTFIERLEEKNVAVLPKTQGDDLLGLTYLLGNVKLAGYQVYKPYSWTKLQSEYGLTYDHQKDSGSLERAKIKAIEFIKNNSNSNTATNTTLVAVKAPQELELSIQTTNSTTLKNEEDEEKTEILSPQHPIPLAEGLAPNTLAKTKKKQRSIPVKQLSAIASEEQPLLSPITEQLKADNPQELPNIIVNYMKVINKNFIEGRELCAKLDENLLQVCRTEDNTPVMQTRYLNGQWNEETNILTTNEIQQIEHLRILTQQILTSRARTQQKYNTTKEGIDIL